MRQIWLFVALMVLLATIVKLAVSYWLGWRVVLINDILTALVGVLVIARYRAHWADLVAKRVDEKFGLPVGRLSSGLLLFGAGVLLIIPSILADALGLCLAIPLVRSLVDRHC